MSINEVLENLTKGGTDITELKKAIDELNKEHENELKKAKNTKTNSELNELKGELNAIKSEFGLNNENSALLQLKELIESKGKSDTAKLNALEVKIAELNSAMKAEKASKLELLKKSALNEMVASIENLNPLFRDDVALRISQALKVDENGNIFFESENGNITKESYLKDFVDKNAKYLQAQGSTGLSGNSSYESGTGNITKEQFEKMSVTDKLLLFKQNEKLYKELDK